MSCSKNYRSSDLCTNRPFLKYKKNTFVKEMISPKSSTKGPGKLGQSTEDSTSKRKRGQETVKLPRSRKNKGLDGSLVGERIKIWWPDDEMFYKCVVESFDSGSKRHKVTYDDGDVEVLLLRDEKWDFISDEKGTSVASETTLRRHKDKSPPSLHPLDLIFEAIGRDTHDVGATAQHVASVGEEQNNMNSLQSKSNMDSLQKMVDFGGQGLGELEQDLHDEPLNASANDADQQAQRSDEHVTKRPLTTSNGGILKKHMATAEMPCIQETGPVHPESRSAQANVNKQEVTQGKDYSISRCLDVLSAIGRDTQDVGATAQHVASVREEQNNMNSVQSKSNMNSLQKMVDFGGKGLGELEQDLHDEPLNASANDANQQAQRSDEHVTKRPLTTSNGGILKKHKATAEMPCIQETGPVHPESRSAQANVNKQEATQGKDYSISRCLDVLSAIGRDTQDVGATAQHVASVGEEQNNMNSVLSKSNMNSLQKMVDFGGQGLDCELEQDLHDEPLKVSANDSDQQAQRSDEHVTKRPSTTLNGGILKKHKAAAEMPCIHETGPVHPESRSAQANVNKQEATQGKDYSISRCLDVLEAMDDVPDGMKILASDVFRDATNREMFLCYAPRLRGPWLKKELEKLHGSHRVN
ncbi:unnamed protein product [Urochloa humidicola]